MSTRICGICSKSFESNGVNKYCSVKCRKIKYPCPSQDPEVQKQKTREYRESHPEYAAKILENFNRKRADKATDDRNSNKEFYRALEFAREMKKYGTTVEWYRDRLIEQNGLCAMCGHLSHHHGTIQRLQVDHDHKCCDLHTKSCGRCLRGLLCADCNILLSYLERFLADLANPQNGEVDLRNSLAPDSWTRRAMQYLKKYASKTQEDSANGFRKHRELVI
jgi:hypothetical protein